MLAALLLAGMVAALLGSVLLFLPARRHRRAAGTWPAIRRIALAVAGTVVLAAAVGGVLKLLSVSEHNLVIGMASVVIASLIWLPVTRRWRARAHLCWASSIFLFVTYLVFAMEWTFASHLGLASTIGALLLWVFELFAAVLACAYLWEICDALGTEHWTRRVTPQVRFDVPAAELPMVSLHVPAHNEPPDMVIDTLRSLLRLDYPRYEIILIDDNTDDEALWRPVQTWCARHGVKFKHLENWPGYKSGALNYALREMTDERAEVIGVVDSDYQIESGFLRRCAPAFAEPWVGFVQSPQDYRGWQGARYYKRLYYSYKYFFAVSQPSRNERDGAIFAGTMGLIRRVALDQLGGWDEWCITEDAELSLRLLRAGFSGLHVDQTWGHGIMPLTFEALKGQRYRWCFGGIQILRMHWRSLIPGRKSRENHLTTAQRWAYLAGGVQWYGDFLGLAFLVFLLAGAANEALGGGALFRKLTVFLVATVPVLVVLGLVRAVALLRRGTGASWRDAIGAFFIWQSTSLVVARASVVGLFARKAAFLRTPKTSEQAKVGGAASQLGGVPARPARARGHRRRADPADPAEWVAAVRAAGVSHAGHGRGAVQQLGRPPGRAACRAPCSPDHRVPSRPALVRRGRRGRRPGHRRSRGGRRRGAPARAQPSLRAVTEPDRAVPRAAQPARLAPGDLAQRDAVEHTLAVPFDVDSDPGPDHVVIHPVALRVAIGVKQQPVGSDLLAGDR
jgi:glycosyltransferase involved in cell wall biosynthesis